MDLLFCVHGRSTYFIFSVDVYALTLHASFPLPARMIVHVLPAHLAPVLFRQAMRQPASEGEILCSESWIQR